MKLLKMVSALPYILGITLAGPTNPDSNALKRDGTHDGTHANWRIMVYSEKDCKGDMHPYVADPSGVGYCVPGIDYKSYHVTGMEQSPTCFVMFFDKDNSCLPRNAPMPMIKSKGTNFEAIDRGCKNVKAKKGKKSLQILCGTNIGGDLQNAASTEFGVQRRK